MSIARFSVTRPVAVTMRIAALVLLGAVCATKLPLDLLPNVSMPIVAVNTTWPNVAPEEIETQLTRPIEEAVSAAPNMYQVSSSSVEGSSTVRIQFRWGTDVGQAAVDVLQLVERARQRFPTDPTLQTPIVFKFDPSQLPIMVYGVSGESDPVKLRTLIDNQITPMLESADGVASAVVTGGDQRAIIVDVDPVKMRAHNISLNQLTDRIVQENVNMPAGIAKQSATEYTIRSLGWFISPADIAKIPIASTNGQTVPLGAIASVRDSHQETRLYTRLNNQPAVGMIISKQSGANTVSTAQSVEEKISQIQKLYPDLKFRLAYDQSEFIQNSVTDLKLNALLGGSMAILILLFYLRNIRSTLVVALSIPTSIVSTFALLYVCGFTLNTMSLGGLALATGLIADDAVVVLESIFRHIERDKKRPMEAAVSGANEIMSAVVASTLTVIVVFIPMFLIKGQAGEMFAQFALVVIFSIAVSLLDATTVVPMLASRLIKSDAHPESYLVDQIAAPHGNGATPGGHGNGTAAVHTRVTKASPLQRMFLRFGVWFDFIDGSYRNGLGWALKHRIWVIAAAVGITMLSFLLVPQIGVEMMPQTDSGDFQVGVKMPPGTALNVTDSVMRQIEHVITSDPNVATAFAASGTNLTIRGTSASLNPNVGAVMVKLKDRRPLSTLEVITNIRRKTSHIPGARVTISQFDLVSNILSGGNQSVEVDIFGDDVSTLYRTAQVAMDRMRGIPGFEGVDVNWQEAAPEMQWKVDRDKALQFGVSFTDVAGALNTATNGSVAGYYQENGFQYPIVVQFPETYRKTESELLDMPITPSMPSTYAAASTGTATPSNGARDVLLMQVAHPTYASGPSEITRIDRRRYIAVTGQPQGRSEGDVQADITKALSGMSLPAGYYWDWGRSQKQRADEFSGMGVAVLLAIGLIYILLAAQFESFVHPLTVLSSIPLSAVGVILALFITGRSFGLTAFIGLLMLVGIVVKNGILLVDYTNVLRGRGMERTAAVLMAGPTRLRPIMMTASAAMLGMLPLAIGLGKGSETQAPMATAIIGGLMTSTMLTLFVVPVVYTFFDDLARRFHKGEYVVAETPPAELEDREPVREETPEVRV